MTLHSFVVTVDYMFSEHNVTFKKKITMRLVHNILKVLKIMFFQSLKEPQIKK